MRTKQLYPGIKNSQKIRVMLNGIGIYTTVAETEHLFATTDHYYAVGSALERISHECGDITGYAYRTVSGIDVQVDFL